MPSRASKRVTQALLTASLLGVLLLPRLAHAESEILAAPTLLGAAESHLQVPPGTLLAQAEGDDAYDPFADYSEFEESMDEEEDINFFRNGRMLTLGFIGGYRGFTQNLGQIYSGNAAFGLFLSYFFDLRFALQIGYLTSDHTMIVNKTAYPVQGTVSVSDIAFLLKYYFNTQNVTRGLAELNPYILGGFSQIYRTTTITGNADSAKDSAFGFNIGAGIEIPMMRNKMFFGLQANYQLISFADEGRVIEDSQGTKTGVSPAGDSYLVLGVLGINF